MERLPQTLLMRAGASMDLLALDQNAVLDVEINTKSGATANKLIFVAWSDDNASVKPKMLYASSKDAIKKALTGINEEYQATDRGDLDFAEIKKKNQPISQRLRQEQRETPRQNYGFRFLKPHEIKWIITPSTLRR